MTTADDLLSQDQRLALMAIFHHELARNPTTTHARYCEWINCDRDNGDLLATQDLENFLRKAAVRGAGKIYDYFKDIVATDPYFKAALPHVRAAITVAFRFRPNRAPINASLDNVYRLICDRDKERRDNIGKTYAGVWNIFRYSGHQEGTTKKDTADPFVLRAAMQIYSPDTSDDDGLPMFKVHYKPDGKVAFEYGTAEGSIIPLRMGNHILFVGAEVNTHHPVDIICAQESRNDGDPELRSFHGLLKRKHERGYVMIANAFFLRSPPGTNIERLDSRLGMLRQSQLAKELLQEYPDGVDPNTIFRQIVNRIPNRGRSALTL